MRHPRDGRPQSAAPTKVLPLVLAGRKGKRQDHVGEIVLGIDRQSWGFDQFFSGLLHDLLNLGTFRVVILVHNGGSVAGEGKEISI